MSVLLKRVGMVKLPLTEGKKTPHSMRRKLILRKMAIVAVFHSWDLMFKSENCAPSEMVVDVGLCCQ